MKLTGLIAVAALALVFATPAYAQTPAQPCCPAGIMKATDTGIADTGTAGTGQQVATTEGAGKDARPADKRGGDGRYLMADGTPCGVCP
jgi:opacity protein-like surface antigen